MTSPDLGSLRGGPPDEGEAASFVKRLHERFGKEVDPEIHLQSPDEADEGTPRPGRAEQESSTSRGLYAKLSEQVQVGRRYVLRREIARGGMGAIVSVWDEDLRRNLAMKVMHSPGDDPERVDPEKLGRFLEEAQITGQLDHPGVVPVHDLGIDPVGRCYFTMRLVRGRELREVLDLTREGKEGWTTTKALALILKVCEAMAYAHSKGVVHRDLKPSNVMVGRFGEVYVMDWGLARVLGRHDSHDLRLRPAPEDVSGVSLVRTVRRDESQANPDSPLVTMDGDVVGTPSFMAVEQAQGRLEDVGPRSDVYSLGAILYYMLSGRSPYVEPGERVSPHTVLTRVLAGPPVPVTKYAKNAPAELLAICEKAMAREAGERYASMLEVADDIQAFLENRVVHAYEGGAVAEFRKWVQRNRGMAAATAALALLTIASAFGFAWQKGQQVEALNAEKAETAVARERAEESAAQALANAENARENLDLALQRKAEADESARVAERNEELARRSSYKANIIAADFSLRLNDVREARKRLDACDTDLRSWEWRHLDLKGDPALVSAGPFGTVDCAAFTPDGSHFLSLNHSGRLRQHDLADGEASAVEITVSSSLSFFSREQRAFDTTRDGRLVAISTGTKKIRLYELATGAQVTEIQTGDEVSGHRGEVTCLAFGPRGRSLATGGEDGSLIVWNVDDGSIEKRFPGHQGAVTAVAWDAFGERLASASRDNAVRVWDVESERELLSLLGHQDAVTDLAWSSDGDRLVSGSDDRNVILWQAGSGTFEKSFLGHEAAVTCVDFHPDGQHVVSGSADRTVRIWDVATRSSRVLRGHEDVVHDVRYNADGTLIVTASGDQFVKVWNASGESCSSTLVDGQSALDSVFGRADPSAIVTPHASVALHPDGVLLAVGDDDGTISIWNGEDGLLHDVLRGHASTVTALGFSADGRLLLSGSLDKTARLWDVESGRTLHVLEGHEKWVGAAALAPDGTWCVTGSGDRLLRVWDTRTGELLETLPGHDKRKGYVYDLAVHPDGQRLASCADDQSVILWRRGSQEPVRTLAGHTRSVGALCFSADGKRLFAGGSDATVRAWSVETGESLFTARGHDSGIDEVALLPDGTRFATASQDGTIRVWDALSGEPLLVIDDPGVKGIAFTPDGTRLLSATMRAVRFWETSGISERTARWSAARARQQELASVVEELFGRHFYLSDVLLRLQSEAGLTGADRVAAERLARMHGDDPWRLDARSRRVVATASLPPEEYESALRRARAACELDPRNAHLQCTLGAAQYRTGRFGEAVSTLRLAGETNRAGGERSDFVFSSAQEAARRALLSMALFRTGDQGGALAELSDLRQMVDADAQLQTVSVVRTLLDEALAMVGTVAEGPEKS